MSQMNVAVVDCSLPIDHENHVTVRPATEDELRAVEEASAAREAEAKS